MSKQTLKLRPDTKLSRALTLALALSERMRFSTFAASASLTRSILFRITLSAKAI